jgi:transcriptional regulator with XRE-family HTH domain
VDTVTSPTGLDLKVARVAARVKQAELGAHMGVTYSRVAAIEREQFPSAETVRRYRAALEACQNVRHGRDAA